ncbi:MAG TPA: hypothetical protein VGM60_14570 [Pseudonocardia sp.]
MGIGTDAAAAGADALWTADLFAAGQPPRFVHPLLRSAVYVQLPSGARSRAHARAARLLSAEDAEPEQVAAQLLLCEPAAEPDAVAALRGAAAAALRRGTPETAVSYLRRALAEPPVGSARAAVLGELGGAERIARDPAAEAHLEQARRASTDPIARARLAAQLADVLFYAGDLARCAEVLRVGLNDLGDRDPDLAVRLHTLTTTVEGNFGWPTPAPEVALKRLRELAARGLPASRCARLVLAHLLAVRGDSCHQVAALVEQGLDDGRFLVEETCEALPTALAVWALICIDDLDRADVLIEAMLVDAQTRGSVVGFVAATGRRGAVALRRGALAEAEADARAAFTLAKEHDLTLGIPLQAAFFGLTLLERGELDEAAAVVEGVTQDPTTMTPYLPTSCRHAAASAWPTPNAFRRSRICAAADNSPRTSNNTTPTGSPGAQHWRSRWQANTRAKHENWPKPNWNWPATRARPARSGSPCALKAS